MKKKLGSCAACLSCKGDSVLLHPRGAGSLSRTQNVAFNTRSTACFVSRATLWPATKRRNISSFRNILSAGPSYQPQKQRKLPFALPGPEAISPRGLYVNDPTESGGEESLQKALEAVVFDDSASMKVREVIRKAISEELRIPNRDLRNVDNSFQNQMACFLVRDKAIIINLEHIKAIIQHDKVYIFNIKNASLDHFFPTFQHRLKPLDGSSSQPFEFRAVEAILSAVNESLYADYWDMKMRIDSLISDIEKKDESELILKSLLDFNKKLNNFQKRVKEVQTAITMVLNSDEDLAAMYLTCKARTGFVTFSFPCVCFFLCS
ncbi:magnesium ion transporter, variant 2 [Balamuthia mandrillaris]